MNRDASFRRSGVAGLLAILLLALLVSTTAFAGTKSVAVYYGLGPDQADPENIVFSIRPDTSAEPTSCRLWEDGSLREDATYHVDYQNLVAHYSCRFDHVAAASTLKATATIHQFAGFTTGDRNGSLSLVCRRVSTQGCTGSKNVRVS